MKRERRFVRFLKREGAYVAFIDIVTRNMDILLKMENQHPALFIGYDFTRHITSVEEGHYWYELNHKWQKVLEKDYSPGDIIMSKQKMVKYAFAIMTSRGDEDEVCRFYPDDVLALEKAIAKLDFQLNRRFK